MTHTTLVAVSGILLLAGIGGCGDSDSPPAPSSPSPLAAPAPAPARGNSFPFGTLTGVSLSGVVYELTATGRTPIAGAVVYCELCGKETHTFATADDNGFYHFSGDLAKGGGVWVVAGVRIPIAVGYYNQGYEDPTGLPTSGFGPGWREVLIDGDTKFDIELVRRAAATR